MVNKMRFDKKNLSHRMLVLEIGAVCCALLCWVIFAVSAIWGWCGNFVWQRVFAAFTLAIIICVVLAWCFWIGVPAKQLAREDRRFADSDILDQVYLPSCYWSDSNRSVIERFQVITDHKAVIAQSIEASRYMALQQQINPHFLYNTLDALRSDMLIAGNDEIAETIEALSRYFSYVVSNMDQLANVYEELGNIRDYFHIQEYRFGERVHLCIINDLVEEDVHDLVLPRMTLQPLVENAITHGLELSEENGTVTIHLEETETSLIIHVMDDGIGMDTAMLNRLNEYLNHPSKIETESRKKRGGIALGNVNSRIKLLFGEAYGLRVQSSPGAGTDISVFLPRRTREETS